MPLFPRCNINLRCFQNVSVTFQLKIPHISFIISFWKCLFWVEVSLNTNYLLFPAPLFQNRAVPLQLVRQRLPKNICLVLIIMSIALKSCALNHFRLIFWFTVFWVHTYEARAQKAAVTWHVSSLSCLIVLKLSNIHKFMLKTPMSYKNRRLCLWR